MRSYVRQQAACEPGGCGAQPGEPCIAYVPKHGKTTGKPTGDVHAARWRAFRAQQRKRVTEREEKVMTAEREEWAATEAGRSAVQAATYAVSAAGHLYEDHGEGLNVGDVADVAYAAVRAADETRAAAQQEDGGTPPPQEPDAPGHDHRWLLLGVQEAPPLPVIVGKPVPRTAVLVRCRVCGLPGAFLLPGAWSLADLSKGWPRP